MKAPIVMRLNAAVLLFLLCCYLCYCASRPRYKRQATPYGQVFTSLSATIQSLLSSHLQASIAISEQFRRIGNFIIPPPATTTASTTTMASMTMNRVGSDIDSSGDGDYEDDTGIENENGDNSEPSLTRQPISVNPIFPLMPLP